MAESNDVFVTHQPLSMTAVTDTGWRAVYIDDEGVSFGAIVAWGVFHEIQYIPGTERPSVEKNVIEGVVPDNEGLGVESFGSAWNDRFVRYLPPGLPEPVDSDDLRRQHREGQARRRGRVPSTV